MTPLEWEQLVNAKTPLVNFRGQWIELDRDKMQQLLEFWQSHGEERESPTSLLPTLLIAPTSVVGNWEKMIAEFQDPETEPSVFILFLKAGGVGITLTKANHVFHFESFKQLIALNKSAILE